MNLGKEFLFCVLFFLIAIAFNIAVSAGLYWLLNVYFYPGLTDRTFWFILAMLIPVGTYFPLKKILKRFNLRKEGEGYILYFGLFLIFMGTIGLADFYKVYFAPMKEIKTIQEVNPYESSILKIENYKISKTPFFHGKIREDKKPSRTFLEAYYVFPFEKSNWKVYYVITYRTLTDKRDDDELKEIKLNDFVKKTLDSINLHDFYKSNVFDRVTVMDYDSKGYNNTFPSGFFWNKDNSTPIIYLQPFDDKLFKEEENFMKNYLIGIFVVYVVLFWLTRLNEL